MTTTLIAQPTVRTRALTVAAAVVAPVAVWGVAKIAGAELTVTMTEGEPAAAVGVPFVIGAALVAALAGWGLLAALERFTRSGARIWTVVAVVALLVSLGGPLTAPDATAGTKAALALMHLAVAVVLIPGLRRAAK